jgi:type II secretory pathway pseudopilin PulG
VSRRTRIGHGADGFSMIELVLTMFVVIIVIGSLALMFVKSNDSAFSSQREVSQLTVLQQQMERIRQTVKEYGFSALALSSAPAAATDSPLPANPSNPDDFVSGSACAQAFQVASNYNNTLESFPSATTIADNPEPLLVNGCTVSGAAISGGQLAPVQYVDLATGASSSAAPAADPYDTVYTFVTATTTGGCNTSLGGSCANDVRRVILAVLPVRAASDVGPAYPTYSTTVFGNPVASNQTTAASGLRVLGLIP